MTAPTARATLEGASARTIPLDDPGDLAGLVPHAGGLAWLHRGDGLVGWGEAVRFDPGTGERRFERANEQLSDFFGRLDVDDEVNAVGTGPLAFGSFTFDPAAPGSVVILPSMVVGRRAGRAWLTRIGEDEAAGPAREQRRDHRARGRVRYAGSSVSELAWLDAVARAEGLVRQQELEKVVLARDLLVWSESALDEQALLGRLATTFPECYTFSCDCLVGATPELLVRTNGPEVESVVLAGSAPRGATQEDDHRLGEGLLASDKDRREHDVGVRSVDHVLAGLCSSREAPDGPSLLRLANVQHLSTHLRGRLTPSLTSLQVAGRLHPTAAVCGLPADNALQLIRSLEGMERARYSGPVGWMDARGNGEWGIALRCAEVDGNRARLFAGAGIVEGSMPEAELEETRLKLRAMQSALDPT